MRISATRTVLAALWTTTSTYACTCAPRGFTWTLDFSLGCEPQSVLVGSGTGILDVTCNIENTDSTMTDITPVSPLFIFYVCVTVVMNFAHISNITGKRHRIRNFRTGPRNSRGNT